MKQALKEALNSNANLVTLFLTTLVLFTGLTVVNNPRQWWVALLGVVVAFAFLALLLNARVVVKATASFLLVAFLGTYCFKFSLLWDATGRWSSLWLGLILFSYFLCLSLSYLVPSGQSRWSALLVMPLLSVGVTLLFVTLGLSLAWAASLGALVQVVLFLLHLRFGRNSFYRKGAMPALGLPEALQEKLYQAALAEGLGAQKLTKGGVRTLLLWDDHHLLQVTSLFLRQQLGQAGGRRGSSYLSYEGHSINPWLLDQLYRLHPGRKAAWAERSLVLLDDANRNGSEPRTIAVALPDTAKVSPVGLMPLKQYKEKDYPLLLKKLFKKFAEDGPKLSLRQVAHLDRSLPLPPEDAPAAASGKGGSTAAGH